MEGELDDEAGRLGGEAKCRPKNSYERRQVAVLVSFDAARRDHFPDVRVCFLGKGGASTEQNRVEAAAAGAAALVVSNRDVQGRESKIHRSRVDRGAVFDEQ